MRGGRHPVLNGAPPGGSPLPPGGAVVRDTAERTEHDGYGRTPHGGTQGGTSGPGRPPVRGARGGVALRTARPPGARAHP
ncbi:predicted protein [Streptomyces sp. SPB78]|nr:predicted protein [Streptomyces sp. SPB78]